MAKDFAAMTVENFSGLLASSAPAPGGGAVSALAGALAAALAAMVAELTKGRQGYEGREEAMQEVCFKAAALREELLQLMQEDGDSFSGVIAALALPKATDEEKQRRSKALSLGWQKATDVPLRIAAKIAEAFPLITVVAARGNRNILADAKAAAILARAGIRMALLNVRVNLPHIKDEEYVRQASLRLGELETQALKVEEAVLAE